MFRLGYWMVPGKLIKCSISIMICSMDSKFINIYIYIHTHDSYKISTYGTSISIMICSMIKCTSIYMNSEK